MIRSASSNISCRTFAGGQPRPTTCSFRFSPAPSPSRNRPSLTEPTVAALLRDDRRVVAHDRAGHVRHQVDALVAWATAPSIAHAFGRVALAVQPRRVVVAHHLEVEPAPLRRGRRREPTPRAGLLGHQGVTDTGTHAAVVPASIFWLPAACLPRSARRPNRMSAIATHNDATMKTSMISTPRSKAAA